MLVDPKPGDLTMSRVKFVERRMEARTGVSYNLLGRLVVSGKMPNEPGDSWLSPKGLKGPSRVNNFAVVEHWMGHQG